MTQEYFFGKAKWVGSENRTATGFSVLRGYFDIRSAKRVVLHAIGLGFFKCYVNGVCVNPDTFLPLSSDYEGSCDPSEEVLSAHRIYVPSFDVTPYVTVGRNTVVIHYGGGWYTHRNRIFGMPKAIYRITAEEEDGISEFFSDETCKIGESIVTDYIFTKYETHDYNIPLAVSAQFDDSSWSFAKPTESLDTQYCETDCPADSLITKLPVRTVGAGARGIIYDCGQNTTGYPLLKIREKAGETVSVIFSEELLGDGALDLSHSHKQEFTVISDGEIRSVHPEFTWFGFRYFEVIGDALPQCVKVIHADVPVTSRFESDNETLNWIYNTFTHTMLCNMHTGHPSDCPHIERRGYTGDGQLTCRAALATLGAEGFYRKWLQDIADGQDTISGHIQYTAPYIKSGGGPGGWGSAIVEVPYRIYKHSGDKHILSRYYENMRRYIDYLEAHSEFGLVTSDKEGEWCLGDWCGPNILYPDRDITKHNQQVILPAAMVNTYFMVRSLNTMREIAHIIGKDKDASEYERKAREGAKAIQAAYFNSFDGNFIMNVQGANSFGVDLGLGSEKTYDNMVYYYEKLGFFDTGIFATDILTRILFERGNGELAVRLLTSDGDQGFEHWRRNGATTFHEYWDSNRSRSHNHPMFGAPVAYFFEYLLGIRQTEGTAGYVSVIIEPQFVSSVNRLSGSIATPKGSIAVSYERRSSRTYISINIPEGMTAIFKHVDGSLPLHNGSNEFSITNQ